LHTQRYAEHTATSVNRRRVAQTIDFFSSPVVSGKSPVDHRLLPGKKALREVQPNNEEMIIGEINHSGVIFGATLNFLAS